jgi:hypothetical protein
MRRPFYTWQRQHAAPAISRAGTWLPLRASLGMLCITLGSCGSGDDTEVSVKCSLVGCGPAFVLQASLELEVETLQDAQVSVCRNGECRAGTLLSESASARFVSATLEPTAASGPAAVPIQVFASAADTPGLSKLEVDWTSWESNEPLVAGPDAYDVTIEANGMSLYAAHKAVAKYQLSHPNGPMCGGTCSSARFSD